jgi:hypothetical protein
MRNLALSIVFFLPALAAATPATRPTIASKPAVTGPTSATAPTSLTATRPSSSPATPAKLLLVTQASKEAAPIVAAVVGELGKSERYATRPLSALRPLLRQQDTAAKVLPRASALLEQARKAMLALDHPGAQAKLDGARAILRTGFVELYAPTRLAQVELLRGVVSLNRARPDLARAAFIEALHLDPTLAPDAHYSPQVRAAFAEAKSKRPARPIPRAALIARALARVDRGRRAVVLAGGRGESGLLIVRALQLAAGKTAGYRDVEALALAANNAGAADRARAFGSKLRSALEAHYPLPKSQPTSRKVVKTPTSQPKHPPPPPKPWYKRWYIWAIAGAVIGAAVAIPLATRKDVIDAQVNWGL